MSPGAVLLRGTHRNGWRVRPFYIFINQSLKAVAIICYPYTKLYNPPLRILPQTLQDRIHPRILPPAIEQVSARRRPAIDALRPRPVAAQRAPPAITGRMPRALAPVRRRIRERNVPRRQALVERRQAVERAGVVDGFVLAVVRGVLAAVRARPHAEGVVGGRVPAAVGVDEEREEDAVFGPRGWGWRRGRGRWRRRGRRGWRRRGRGRLLVGDEAEVGAVVGFGVAARRLAGAVGALLHGVVHGDGAVLLAERDLADGAGGVGRPDVGPELQLVVAPEVVVLLQRGGGVGVRGVFDAGEVGAVLAEVGLHVGRLELHLPGILADQ